MKRASYITLIAIVLLSLAAVGWIVSLFRKPLAHEPSSRRRRRRELPVRSHELGHELREARRHRARPVMPGALFPMPIVFAR